MIITVSKTKLANLSRFFYDHRDHPHQQHHHQKLTKHN